MRKHLIESLKLRRYLVNVEFESEFPKCRSLFVVIQGSVYE
jgi:hypothetical protein